jgi:hypothetical protein
MADDRALPKGGARHGALRRHDRPSSSRGSLQPHYGGRRRCPSSPSPCSGFRCGVFFPFSVRSPPPWGCCQRWVSRSPPDVLVTVFVVIVAVIAVARLRLRPGRRRVGGWRVRRWELPAFVCWTVPVIIVVVLFGPPALPPGRVGGWGERPALVRGSPLVLLPACLEPQGAPAGAAADGLDDGVGPNTLAVGCRRRRRRFANLPSPPPPRRRRRHPLKREGQ